jgi:hypothetical protein
MKPHSPFLVIEEFVSPATCERLLDEYSLKVPDVDTEGRALKHERFMSAPDRSALLERLDEQALVVEQQFHGVIKGLGDPVFQQYFEDPTKPCEPHQCESARYLRKKWIKHKDVDLVGFLWLKSYNSTVPLDPRMEVYGGKLEFPAYDFSLMPQRGTLVLFPACPHFIFAVSHCLYGTLQQVKFNVTLRNEDDSYWLYQPKHFPGSYQDWFL